MAIRHSSIPTHSVSTAVSDHSNKPTSATEIFSTCIRDEYYVALAKFSKLSGVPFEELLDEALHNFIACSLSARAEALIKEDRRIAMVKKKAARKREIDAYLTKLECDLNLHP